MVHPRSLACLGMMMISMLACDDEASTTPQDAAPSPGADAAPVEADAGTPSDAAPVEADAGTPSDAAPVEADVGVTPDTGPLTPAQQIEAVEARETWQLPTLARPVQVLLTEHGVPHIYAADRLDLRRVMGFLIARDRYLTLDLFRRASTGRLGELVGSAGLSFDILARAQGQLLMAEHIDAWLTDELRAENQAMAEGINAYIEMVAEGRLPPPTELDRLAPLLGGEPAELMKPFDAFDISAVMASTAFMTGFESVDLEHSQALDALRAQLAGTPEGEAHLEGMIADVFQRIAPIHLIASAPSKSKAPIPQLTQLPKRQAAPGLLDGLVDKLGSQSALWWRRPGYDKGSNAWAVSGAATRSGGGLLAGDGHLQFWVPTLLYRLGADTSVYGEGDVTFAGLVLPGAPPYAIGTNGRVAWSFTYFYGDLTDWFREELRLGEDGLPEAARFQGAWRPLIRVEERYALRGIFGQADSEVTSPRFELEDGRRLMAIEGRAVTDEAPAEEGEVVVDLGGGPVVPGDVDGDGIIEGVSMAYVGLSIGPAMQAYDEMARADSVEAFRAAHRRLGTNGSSFVAADAAGGILNTGYHAAPRRLHLPRDPDGGWVEGADPTQLIDGARFGAFQITLDEEGLVESGETPEGSVTPYESFPYALDPPSGFVFTANNDPDGGSFDDDLSNDAEYLGGVWRPGFRAKTIHDRLEALVAQGGVGVEEMATLQADKASVTGARYLEPLLEAIRLAREGDPELDAAAAYYAADAAAMEEVMTRLEAWAARGFEAASGVETFYEQPDEAARADAVATMIFNAWLGHVVQRIFADEAPPAVDRFGDKDTQIRAVENLLLGRGAGNPAGLASWREETGESILFDDLRTPEREGSQEILVGALAEALAFLRSPETAPGEGGFGTEEMDAWLWGLRHTVRFEHILQALMGGDGLGAAFANFGITPRILPVRPDLPANDPLNALPGYPRGGDNFNVDAGHPRLLGDRFEYRHGAVMRMVVAFEGDRVVGQNIIPGGQSGLLDSPHFADQAALWLGNQTTPLRFHLDQVLEGAEARLVFTP